MAHAPLNQVFHIYEPVSASHSRRSSVSRGSQRSRRLRRRKSFGIRPIAHEASNGETVYDVPSPTISQLRRGSLGVFTESRRQSLYNENEMLTNQELTEEQLYELLQEHNTPNAIRNGTIRLPSDILYRRKSRLDDIPLDIGTQPTADKLNVTNIAMAAARRREEDDPVKKTYKKLSTFYRDHTLLRTTLNRIQGRYGAAIMEYFSFVKWLVMLNIVISLLTLPLIIPQLVLEPLRSNTSDAAGNDSQTNSSCFEMAAEQCSIKYEEAVENSQKHNLQEVYLYLFDFIQGTGYFENTLLFHGYYNEVKLEHSVYPMSIMFLCITFFVLIFSLIWTLYSISRDHEDSVVATSDSTTTQNFSIAVLAGWDHGLTGKSAAKIKKGLLKQEFQQLIANEEYKKMAAKRTRVQKYALWSVRLLVNLIVFAAWAGCGVAIFEVSRFVEDQTRTDYIEYLPTVVITAIYLVIPTIFSLIVKLERYRPSVELGVTMARILFLRLASLFFLFITTFNSLSKFDSPGNGTKSCDGEMISCTKADATESIPIALNYCWETYLGQQIYRLVILDFLVLLATTYLLEYPRQVIYKKFEKTKLMSRIGQQEFDMPKNVMDVLYNQILCWIGLFFAPLIPALITLKMVLFFLIKRGSLFSNQRPSPTLSKSSALSSFFYLVMWISLVLAYLVLVVYMQFVTPSQSCGPFRVHLNDDYDMFDALTSDLPQNIKDILFVLESWLLQGAIILLLLIMWYLFATVSNGLSGEIKLYVSQLRKSVMDKTFFLKKVNSAIQETNALSNTQLYRSTMADRYNGLLEQRAPRDDIDHTSLVSTGTESIESGQTGRVDVHRGGEEEALNLPARGTGNQQLSRSESANMYEEPSGEQSNAAEWYPVSARPKVMRSDRRLSRQFSEDYLDSSSSEDSDAHYRNIYSSRGAIDDSPNYMNMPRSQPKSFLPRQTHYFDANDNFMAFRRLSKEDRKLKKQKASNGAAEQERAKAKEDSDYEDYEGPSLGHDTQIPSRNGGLLRVASTQLQPKMLDKMTSDKKTKEREQTPHDIKSTDKFPLRRVDSGLSAGRHQRHSGHVALKFPNDTHTDGSAKDNIAKVPRRQRAVNPDRNRGPRGYDNVSYVPDPDY